MQSEIVEGFRVSPQQEHLWFLQQSSRNTSDYRSQCAVIIDGPLDAETLHLALRDIVRRHEILRTGFQYLPGMAVPVQVVNEAHTSDRIGWNVERYSPTSQPSSPETLLDEQLRRAKQNPFSFEHGPLVHAVLSVLSPVSHVLVLSLPALCADRTTLRNIIAELSLGYAARTGGKEFDEETRPEVMQYADFSEWQNELFELDETQAGRNFWRQQSLSQLSMRHLPFEKATITPTGSDDSDDSQFSTQSHRIELSGHLRVEVERLAAALEVSVPTLLEACWQVLLWKQTGQSEIVVGTTYGGRAFDELKDALGLFAKCLPVTARLDGDMACVELLKSMETVRIEVGKRQEYFRWEEIEDAGARTPDARFFPYGFEYAEEPAPYIAGELTLRIAREEVCIDRSKILLTCVQTRQAIRAEFNYDGDLFHGASIEVLSAQYEKLLNSVVENPQARIADLEIVNDAERHRLVTQWNKTQARYTLDETLHTLFQAQAVRTPDAIALVSDEDHQQLSYSQLNTRANQLAHLLISSGVTPDARVALLFERSTDMLVTLIATLKAGAAYLPLDPDYPADRL
ncbi:MAG: condensation domain-containing protein, partial [Acidobacteria bacterium]|nr:condensation domain-containing protein [Acidobacteriota bacterium]